MEVGHPNRLRFGAFEFDPKAGELRKGARKVLLQEQPFQLLLMLVERRGDIVTLDEIKKRFWPNDTVVEFDHSIHTAIKKLRQALGDSAENPRYIETVARRGYRLIMPVESGDDSSRDPAAEGASSFRPPLAKAACPERAEGWESDLIGRKVSHYRVLEIIGGGGMGLVYKAEDLKLGRRVALKFLPEELANDPVALQRFEREAQTASSLNHPNICTIHEVEEHEGQPFIVMELLEGETLRDRLAAATSDEKPIRLDELLWIALQVAGGLEAAHETGIIHRDIKPANIFLTKKGPAKILDFGLAKLVPAGENQQAAVAEAGEDLKGHDFSRAVQDSSLPPGGLEPATDLHLTRTGSAMGTAGYMSPEQVRGEKLDARTDLFSFGLVIYEMATGRRPFCGDTAAIVHDAILNQEPVPVREINSTVPPELQRIIDKALQKDCEQRYQSAAVMHADLERVKEEAQLVFSRPSQLRWELIVTAAAALLILVVAGNSWRRWREPGRLTASDTVVLADFTNHTSDPAFDTALKPALEVELGQTPFLNVLSAEKVRGSLRVMGHPEDDRLTPRLARDVCEYTKSKAVLESSIADAGNQYQIEIKAIDCKSRLTLADAVAEAGERSQLVGKLDEAGNGIRKELGEPPNSLRAFNQPLDEAATSSIEALQAYAAGAAAFGTPDAVSHLKRAAELDPKFALAYRLLAACYNNLMQDQLESENATTAYQLRQRTTRRDELDIEAFYYSEVTGEWEKAISTWRQEVQDFPRWGKPRHLLGYGLRTVGRYEAGADAEQDALRLMPDNMSPYVTLAQDYFALNRLDDAKLVLEQAKTRIPDSWNLRWGLYRLAFLQNDQNGMQEQVQWATSRPGVEDFILREQSETEAYYGKLGKAHELSKRAVESAIKAGAPERAAQWRANEALRATEVSEPRAIELAQQVLKLHPGQDAAYVMALTFANLHNATRALELSQQLNRQFPLSTLVQESELPTIEAVIYLRQGLSNRAIEALKRTTPYDLRYADHFAMQAVYVRGQAYLKAGQGQQAAAEFRKLIDHPGIVGNSINGPLARLQLARAQLMMGDKTAARKSYQDFLTLWKDADPDIPIYQQAKAEYARLR